MYIEEELSATWLEGDPPSARINVVFSLQLQTFWPLYESVVLSLKNNSAFNPLVLLTPMIQGSLDMSHIQYYVDEMQSLGIPVVGDDCYNIHKEMPDLIFFTSPYVESRKVSFFPQLLHVHHTRAAIIPYCTEVMGDERFMDLYFSSCLGYWRYFTSSAMCRRGYLEINKFPEVACPVTGNPEYDFVLNKPSGSLKKYQDIRKKAGRRKILLWTPHFSQRWGSFGKFGVAMIKYFAALSDVLFVVLRPHHILSVIIHDAMHDKASTVDPRVCKAMDIMRLAGNFYIDTEGPGIESVYAADGLVSDLSSMLTKGMALSKSLFFLKSPEYCDIGIAGPVMDRHMHTGVGMEDIKRFTTMLLCGGDPLLPVPDEVREYFCGPVDGKSGERIAEHLERYFFPG